MKLMSKSGGDATVSPLTKKSTDGQRVEEVKEQKISALMGGGSKTDSLVKSL